jgi:hypothetical protein
LAPRRIFEFKGEEEVINYSAHEFRKFIVLDSLPSSLPLYCFKKPKYVINKCNYINIFCNLVLKKKCKFMVIKKHKLFKIYQIIKYLIIILEIKGIFKYIKRSNPI